MKKRYTILLVLTISLLISGAVASAQADTGRKVTGGWQWTTSSGWNTGKANIHEVAPGEAKGDMRVHLYDKELGWRRWNAKAVCLGFGEGFADEPAVSMVVQIERISGWGPGTPGQYIKLWVSDGGTPAPEGDRGGVVLFPQDARPDCGYELPVTHWPFDLGGNVVIHE